MQVGDRMPHRLTFMEPRKGGGVESVTATLPCQVVFIHPTRRWYTLRVELPGGRSFCTSEFMSVKQ